MSEFPTDDPTARYQFFKLVTDVAYGADDQTDALFAHYGAEEVAEDTPVLATIEDIANPVLRQAAPAFIVSNMKYLVDFVQSCDVYIMGQTKSLVAYDPNLAKPEFNAVVTEDALFLRQILSESLQRLGAEDDPVWADVRLAKSNQTINAEIDRDVLKDAIALSNEMTETAEERSKQESLRRLIRIFTGGG